jgi:hypothetical protein
MLARRIALCVGLAAAVASCSSAVPDERDEPVARTHSAILAGRPSGDDENANVYIEAVGDGGAALRCSGRIVAPGLVVSTRHCFLERKTAGVSCTPDGESVDIPDMTDLSLEPPERITVSIGSSKSALRAVAVREVIALHESTICRSDMAFLVLAEPGLEVRTPLRRGPVEVGEKLVVSGWGYTSDGATALPETRYTREQIPVSEVGPAFIPAGTFAMRGNTLCYGDSGAAALIDGAVVGVYSRLDGSTSCSLEQARNIFTGIWAEEQLVSLAYAAIGEEPWYAGERRPWLAGTGARCTEDDECQSAVCEAASNTCRAPCGDAGLACPIDQRCDGAEGACISSGGEPGLESSSSCSVAHLVRGAAGWWWGPAAFLGCLLRRLRPRGGVVAAIVRA